MPKLSDQAIKECEREMRAACRITIDQAAWERIVALVRPNFENILDKKGTQPGEHRWVSDGPILRDNGRYIGSFAEFFTNREGHDTVGFGELLVALLIVQTLCPAGKELKYCEGAVDQYKVLAEAVQKLVNEFGVLIPK